MKTQECVYSTFSVADEKPTNLLSVWVNGFEKIGEEWSDDTVIFRVSGEDTDEYLEVSITTEEMERLVKCYLEREVMKERKNDWF